jgi:hypothetical protein
MSKLEERLKRIKETLGIVSQQVPKDDDLILDIQLLLALCEIYRRELREIRRIAGTHDSGERQYRMNDYEYICKHVEMAFAAGEELVK